VHNPDLGVAVECAGAAHAEHLLPAFGGPRKSAGGLRLDMGLLPPPSPEMAALHPSMAALAASASASASAMQPSAWARQSLRARSSKPAAVRAPAAASRNWSASMGLRSETRFERTAFRQNDTISPTKGLAPFYNVALLAWLFRKPRRAGSFDLLDLALDDMQAVHVAVHLGHRVLWYGGAVRVLKTSNRPWASS